MVMLSEVTENERIIERHLHDIDPLYDSLWQPIGPAIRINVVYMTDMAEGRNK